MSDLGPGMSYVFTPEWHAQIRRDREEKQRLQKDATEAATALGHSLWWINHGLDFATGRCGRCDMWVKIGVGAPLKGFVIGTEEPAVSVKCSGT